MKKKENKNMSIIYNKIRSFFTAKLQAKYFAEILREFCQ